MGTELRIFLLTGLTLLTLGCAAKRRPTGINVVVPISCLSAPLIFYDCDPTDPAHICKHMEPIEYKPNCVVVNVKK